jgi:hypothetical protein
MSDFLQQVAKQPVAVVTALLKGCNLLELVHRQVLQPSLDLGLCGSQRRRTIAGLEPSVGSVSVEKDSAIMTINIVTKGVMLLPGKRKQETEMKMFTAIAVL